MDLIDRQAAIKRATKEHDFFRGAVTVSDKARRDELLNVMCWLGELPPAQPAELATLIKALEKEHKKLLEMQGVPPEIIHCNDCQHSEYDAMYGDRYCHHNGKAEIVPDNHYCGYGERRTNERSD